jgi:hypothetical protein
MALKRIFSMTALACLSVAAACGGGGGDSGVVSGGSSTITASFVAGETNPQAGSVSMAQDSVSGDVVTIRIRVTDTQGIYGAAFDVIYDPATTTYVGWAPGTLLEQGGNAPNYTVSSPQAGRVVVGASRTGNVSAVNAVGTAVLLRLSFRARQTGSSPINFQAASLSDAQVPPQALLGIHWSGGLLVGG